MRRRDLLGSMAGGYSLYVFAGTGAQAQTPAPPSSLHDPGRFKAIALHSEARLASA